MSATRVIDDHLELANIGTKTHANIEGHIQGIGNYAFPSADGALNQILETDGAGAISWVNKPSGFVCGNLNACNLTDIGTRAHSSLTGIGTNDHHTKYTDAEAVAAADASDKFIERSVENLCTSWTTFKRTASGTIIKIITEKDSTSIVGTLMLAEIKNPGDTYFNTMYRVNFPAIKAIGNDKYEYIMYMRGYKPAGQTSSQVDFYLVNNAGSGFSPLSLYYDKIDVKNLPIKDMKNHVASALSGTKRLVEIDIGGTPYYFEVYPTKA